MTEKQIKLLMSLAGLVAANERLGSAPATAEYLQKLLDEVMVEYYTIREMNDRSKI